MLLAQPVHVCKQDLDQVGLYDMQVATTTMATTRATTRTTTTETRTTRATTTPPLLLPPLLLQQARLQVLQQLLHLPQAALLQQLLLHLPKELLQLLPVLLPLATLLLLLLQLPQLESMPQLLLPQLLHQADVGNIQDLKLVHKTRGRILGLGICGRHIKLAANMWSLLCCVGYGCEVSLFKLHLALEQDIPHLYNLASISVCV